MDKVTQGNIVKFSDTAGKTNGGTVIEIIKKDNAYCALINTLEGKKIIKKISELIPIKRQQRGRVSAKFMSDFKDEINSENKNIMAYTSPAPISSGESERHLSPTPTLENNKDEKASSSLNIEEEETILSLKNQLILKDQLIISLKESIDQLSKENDKLRTKNEAFSQDSNVNVEQIKYTIKGLGNALLAASTSNNEEVIKELICVIEKLNGI